MFTRQQAYALQDYLMEQVGGLTKRAAPRSMPPLPRPPFMPIRSEVLGVDLTQAMLPPLLGDVSKTSIHEVFAGVLDLIAHEDASPYKLERFIRSSLDIDRGRSTILFPPFTGLKKQGRAHHIGLVFYLAHCFGFQVLYGDGWIYALSDEITFGIDDGKAICEYEELCIELPHINWKGVMEGPRPGGEFNYKEIQILASDLKKDPGMYNAFLVLIWSDKHRLSNIRARIYFGEVGVPLAEYIRSRVFRSDTPIKTYRELLVPHLVSGPIFDRYKGMREALDYEMFLEDHQVETLVEESLIRFGIK